MIHFFDQVISLEIIRKEIFQLIESNFPKFSALDNKQKLFWFLNIEDKEILILWANLLMITCYYTPFNEILFELTLSFAIIFIP